MYYHHLSVLCDRMTCNDKMVSIFRHGINNDDIGPIAKASFEETPEMFLKAARHGELDTMRGISANIMCGQEGYFGTSAFSCVLDNEAMANIKAETKELIDEQKMIETAFGAATDDPCSISNLTIPNNISNIQPSNMGELEDSYNLDF